MSNNTVLKLVGIEKTFEKRKVLDLEIFELMENEKIIINGENGCGKSTLFKVICGVILPDCGNVENYGNDVSLIFSGAKGFYGYLTAYDNIKYYLGLNKVKIKNVSSELEYLVNRLNFNEHLHNTFDKLSLGNKQKCTLIAGLLLKSKVLLVDEPTIGLDIDSVRIVSELLSEYEGSMIVITHDKDLISQLKMDVCLMNKGTIEKRVDWEEFLASKKETLRYLIKTKESLEHLGLVVEDGFYVVLNKQQCNAIFVDYNVLEFKVVT